MSAETEIINPITETKIPHLLKYMGSKREILDFVTDAIEQLDVESDWVCDLFAGTGVVSGSVKTKYKVHSNDIQSYSAILSETYLTDFKSVISLTKIEEIKNEANVLVNEFRSLYPELKFDYSGVNKLDDVIALEKSQQLLINKEFNIGFHLFAKNYSGTYWSYDQCVWIDSLRCVAENYNGKPEYLAIMSALISAMSQVSQSTGHYAQYRDVNEDNLLDILIYRNRQIWIYFERKFNELIISLNGAQIKGYKITRLDYLDCLRVMKENSIVYADPPYQSVHYSRFYHTLETLVRYDYPNVSHKGRYRDDRHQSPFCKKTTVKEAFKSLFHGVRRKKSHLALSYSDTGIITLSQILLLGKEVFKDKYKVSILEKDHIHSNMGRSDENQQDVIEYIILFKMIDDQKA
jgi:adenine-specific DNA-methyltransferase